MLTSLSESVYKYIFCYKKSSRDCVHVYKVTFWWLCKLHHHHHYIVVNKIWSFTYKIFWTDEDTRFALWITGLFCVQEITLTWFFLSSGNIIGSGIFISPKGVLEHSGSVGLALVVWVLGGGVAALGSLCYAELGVTIPKSGGDYSYVTEIFGGLVGYDRSIYDLLNSEWKSNVCHRCWMCRVAL